MRKRWIRPAFWQEQGGIERYAIAHRDGDDLRGLDQLVIRSGCLVHGGHLVTAVRALRDRHEIVLPSFQLC
jgi:hypothetical protein